MPETVHLAPDADFVPEHLLTPPAADEKRHVLRDLAAFLLDRHLRRLSLMKNPLDLRLGRLLSRMVAASGYLECGFARASDYATERLGISPRLVQELVQMDRRLGGLPLITEAFREGRISRSQVRLLLRVATPDSEARWLEIAARLNVRRLEREVVAARRLDSEGESSAIGVPVVDDSGSACPAGFSAAGSSGEGRPSDDDEDDEPGAVISLQGPGVLAARWEWALEVCRRASGAAEPAWRCAEFIAADYLAGVPDLAGLLGRSLGGPDGGEADEQRIVGGPHDAPIPSENDEGVELFEEVLRGMEDEYGRGGWVPSCEGLRVALPESVRDDPADDVRRLDARLREAVRLRQNLSWHQGRLIRTFADLGLHRDLGFQSLGRYCRERLGLGLRRARQLIALERHLLELPVVAAAYRQGAVSWVQVSALARVADETNEDDWLHLARSVTVRRLREEVALAEGVLNGAWPPPGDRHCRKGDPHGIDGEGRVRLRLPSPRPPHEAVEGEGSASQGAGAAAGDVQTCAPDASSWTRIRFWAPEDVARLWQHALDVCRLVDGGWLAGWECLDRMLSALVASWQVRQDPVWRRRYRIFERDGWRCRVPGCSSRRNLQEHHVIFRSHGGGDEDENLVAICATHHLQGIHAGRLLCHRLPDGLLAWELGPQGGGGPVVRYVEDVLWEAAREGRGAPDTAPEAA
jgi:hypothetical protein